MSQPSPYVEPAAAWSLKKGLLAFAALVFVFLELGLRVVNVPSLQQRIDPIGFEEARSPLRAHPYTAFALDPNHRSDPDARFQVSHNALGFRGEETTWEKPEGVLRVVCLGGSSTYGEGVSGDERTWPARLQVMLDHASGEGRYEVLNLGVPGYSSFESLTQLAVAGLELEPDVLVVYHGLSDVRCALSDEPAPDNTHYRLNWPTTRTSDLDAFFEQSRVYCLLRSFVTDTSAQRLQSAAIATRDEADRALTGLPQPQGFRNLRRNLESIVALGHSAGARVILATQAVDQRDLIGRADHAAVAMGIARAADIVRDVAKERDAEFVDAAATLEGDALRQIRERGSENVFQWEDRLRDAGAELLALTLADAVLRVELAR